MNKLRGLKWMMTGFLILGLAQSAFAVSVNKEIVQKVDTTSTADQIISTGKKYLGTPYEFGSDRSTTRTFDCSDFVRQAFGEGAGIELPSNSRTQAQYVKENGKVTMDWRELKRGDIVFFISYRGPRESDYQGIDVSSQRITHNGIYLGDGKIMHTYSKESGGVRIDSLENKHWEYRFVFGGSILHEVQGGNL